jgi:flagellar biosynthesis protein FlhA
MSHHAPSIADPVQLAEAVRARIGGLIVAGLSGDTAGHPLQVIALAPGLEQLLVSAQRAAPGSEYPFEPGLGARLVDAVAEAAAGALTEGKPVALVTQSGPRRALWRLLRLRPGIPVLAFPELQDNRAIEVIAVVGEELVGNRLEKV